jgi:hypothetical protein
MDEDLTDFTVRCTFGVCCRGPSGHDAPAATVWVCHTCKKYDKTKCGYYCDACFKMRHPWYVTCGWGLVSGVSE